MLAFKPVSIAAAVFCSIALAGCGDSGGSAPAAGGTRSVIASASDCVSFGEDAVKTCAEAIERAVAAHEASSTLHTDLAACEQASGPGNCERAPSGKYRAKLSAFAVTIGGSARAEPLYPTKDGSIGFQTASNATLLASDRSIAFSRLALSVAEAQAPVGKKGRNKL